MGRYAPELSDFDILRLTDKYVYQDFVTLLPKKKQANYHSQLDTDILRNMAVPMHTELLWKRQPNGSLKYQGGKALVHNATFLAEFKRVRNTKTNEQNK